MKNIVHIVLWGREVGTLMWKKDGSGSYFTYNNDYIENGWNIAPLVAPLKNSKYRNFRSEDERIYQRLPAFIADSLPDDWGNLLFDQWRKESKIPASEITPLDKLTFIGKRGMGALEFLPDMKIEPFKDSIDISSLVDLAQRIFLEREQIQILPSEALTKQLLISVGTSAGGRQPKAIIAINKQTGDIRSWQIANLDGYDYYILKFGDSARYSAELEMVYYEMAKEAGINIMPSELLNVEGQNHFLTK